MTLIEWKKEYSVGVPAIDHEHRELIELINELYRHARSGDSPHAIGDFLGEIFARISAHFALEEKLMREKNYDEYDEHKADHEVLLDEIRDLMDEFEDGTLGGENELFERLDAWFGEHFQTKDARLHRRLG